MPKYRSKPVVVDAEQFFYDRPTLRGVYYPNASPDGRTYKGDAFVITAHEQRVYLQNGDWVIAESDGEHYYPCKNDVFRAKYEPADAPPPFIAAPAAAASLDMLIDGYVNYVIASKAIRLAAMPFRAWIAAGDRE